MNLILITCVCVWGGHECTTISSGRSETASKGWASASSMWALGISRTGCQSWQQVPNFSELFTSPAFLSISETMLCYVAQAGLIFVLASLVLEFSECCTFYIYRHLNLEQLHTSSVQMPPELVSASLGSASTTHLVLWL